MTLSPAAPEVPAWILADPSPVRVAAQGLAHQAEQVRSLEAALRASLADAATTLGWRSPAADAAGRRTKAELTTLARVASAIEAATEALLRLAKDWSTRAQEIRSLMGAQESAFGRLSDSWSGAHQPDVDADTPLRAALNAHAEIAAHIAALERTNNATSQTLQYAAETLLSISAAPPSWLNSLAPIGSMDALVAAGVLMNPAERQALTAARHALSIGFITPTDRAGRIREALAAVPTARLEPFLLANPEVARALAADPGEPWGYPSQRLSGQAHPGAMHIQGWFAALPAEVARRTALTYPTCSGSTDGVPFAERVAANRVLMAIELDRLNETVAATPADQQEHLQQRITLIDRLLHEELPNPAPGPDRPEMVQHQVVLFDPQGPGRFAEMWGQMDAHTRHVALYVPGAGLSLEELTAPSDTVRELAQGDSTGASTAILWMGHDSPQQVSESLQASSATQAGPALTSFAAGADPLPRADVTVIGHQFGGSVVGAALDQGLVADRVVFLDSPGMGPGVTGTLDYPSSDTGFYAINSPMDDITRAGFSGWIPSDADLARGTISSSLSPAGAPGVTVLPGGEPGEAGAFVPGSPGWQSLQSVIWGRAA